MQHMYHVHVTLFTSWFYPDFAPINPPEPPPDLGEEARPLRGIFWNL